MKPYQTIANVLVAVFVVLYMVMTLENWPVIAMLGLIYLKID